MTVNEIYVNRKTGKQVKVIEVNDKYNTIMYESEDGKTKQATSINFRKSFKLAEQIAEEVKQEPVNPMDDEVPNSLEEILPSLDEEVSSDGTPYKEVMKEIQADEKLAVEKKAKKKAKAEKKIDNVSRETKREEKDNILRELADVVSDKFDVDIKSKKSEVVIKNGKKVLMEVWFKMRLGKISFFMKQPTYELLTSNKVNIDDININEKFNMTHYFSVNDVNEAKAFLNKVSSVISSN